MGGLRLRVRKKQTMYLERHFEVQCKAQPEPGKHHLKSVNGLCKLVFANVAFGIWVTVLLSGCGGQGEELIGKPGPLEQLHLEADAGGVIVGETVQLTVIAHIGNGVVNQTSACHITSSDESVARILPNGIVQGLDSGKVKIIAEIDGVQSNVLELEVLHAPPPPPGSE